MRLGTGAALKVALQGLGFSGRLNTAFLERVNLTVRHGVAALARRTWATAKPAPQLLAHLQWWRAYSHFVRPHTSLRLALVQPAAARWQAGGAPLPAADSSSGSGENQPTVDSAGSAQFSLAVGATLHHLRASFCTDDPRRGRSDHQPPGLLHKPKPGGPTGHVLGQCRREVLRHLEPGGVHQVGPDQRFAWPDDALPGVCSVDEARSALRISAVSARYCQLDDVAEHYERIAFRSVFAMWKSFWPSRGLS
jgi:hypothetical protein